MLRTTPHTRLPLCEDNLDNIIGMLHMKKVAHALAHGEISREVLLRLAREREAYFVPDGTTLDVQLQNFQRDRRRIALVVDEYGDIRGLVTLEDILEEIVGEFTSDPGTLHKDIHREADGSYVVNGATNVRVLNRTLGWTLPTDGPRTLNGLVLEYLENIPEPGTSLKLGNISVEILQAVDNAVKTARLRPLATAAEARASEKEQRTPTESVEITRPESRIATIECAGQRIGEPFRADDLNAFDRRDAACSPLERSPVRSRASLLRADVLRRTALAALRRLSPSRRSRRLSRAAAGHARSKPSPVPRADPRRFPRGERRRQH